MKFDPSWRQVALLAVLVAAVPLTYAFTPLAVAVVTSMVSTIMGALFVNLQSSKADPPDAPGAPELKVLPGGKE